jgi:hypothetical protein
LGLETPRASGSPACNTSPDRDILTLELPTDKVLGLSSSTWGDFAFDEHSVNVFISRTFSSTCVDQLIDPITWIMRPYFNSWGQGS